MTETNTVPGIEVNELTGSSVLVFAATAPTVRSFVMVRHQGRGSSLLPAAALMLTSSAAIESDLTAFSQAPLRSAQTTESRLLPDEEGPDARQIRRLTLYRLRSAQFPQEERNRRIARALATLHSPNPLTGVDRATWKWAAEEADLEDL
jgi:hypothetical protein